MSDAWCRRCKDCIHFEPERFATRDRGRKRKEYHYGCKKSASGFTPYWVDSLRMHNIYDNALGCFEGPPKQLSFEVGGE